jgi:glycosyltransferase involved in cell wall biosynthesis
MTESAAPRVSVVVRTKDRPRLLGEALASLRAQTFQDFEVIVVNDGGVPPAGLDPAGAGLRVVTTEPPHGRSRALDTGLRAARGRFVAYLDDDDLFLPHHL